jgi:thiol-disulfide isomerase/thioredoxin
MIRLLLGTIAFSTSTLAFGCSAESPPNLYQIPAAKQDGSTKPDVQKALEIGKDHPEQAIAILESALKASPNDREANFLLGVMTVVQGERSEQKNERITLFHKAFAAFERLKNAHKERKPEEKSFEPRVELGEARALALEGKTNEAFDAVKRLMSTGNQDLDSIETVEDLQPLQALPAFREFIEATYGPKLAEALQEVPAELAATKSFPFDFQLKDLDGNKVSMADYRGKLTIVDLWGTWCPPCRREIPHLVALSKKYKEKGLEIVGINCEEEGTEDQVKKTIRDFAKAYKIDYKCLLNDDTVQTKVPDFQAFPTMLFIDRSGKVRLVLVGAAPKAKLEAIITTLLAEGSKAP